MSFQVWTTINFALVYESKGDVLSMHARDLPTMPTPRKFWARPAFWVVLTVVVVGAAFITQSVQRFRETQRIAEAAFVRFETQLAAEDFAAARESLREAEANTTDFRRVANAESRRVEAETLAEQYDQALRLAADQRLGAAIDILAKIEGYKDSRVLIGTYRIQIVKSAVAMEDWKTAYEAIGNIPKDVEEVQELLTVVQDKYSMQNYRAGLEAKAQKEYSKALALLESARTAGGKVPTDLDDQIKSVTALKARADAQAEIEGVRRSQNVYTSGPVGLAVGGAEFQQTVGRYYAKENSTFVLVYVSVKNLSLDREHANPNNFTLSSPGGQTSAPHIETYGLNNYFDAVDLRKGQSTSGWLVFIMPQADMYTLNYSSFYADAAKRIAPE